jgi:hypothetical protein
MKRRRQKRSAAHRRAIRLARQRTPSTVDAARHRRRALELAANAEWLDGRLVLAPVRHVLEAMAAGNTTLRLAPDDHASTRWWLERSDNSHRQFLKNHPELIAEVLMGFAKDSGPPL